MMLGNNSSKKAEGLKRLMCQCSHTAFTYEQSMKWYKRCDMHSLFCRDPYARIKYFLIGLWANVSDLKSIICI